MPGAGPKLQIFRIDALGVLDAAGSAFSPGSVLIEFNPDLGHSAVSPTGTWTWPLRVLAIGAPDEVATHPAAQIPSTRLIRCPSSILIPGLVNAHTHLDLTHIGPLPHDPDQGFIPWIDMIRGNRRTEDTAIAASVRQGAELSLRSAVIAVGDIAGSSAGRLHLTPWRTLSNTPLIGVSFLEYFGIGNSHERAFAAVSRTLDSLDLQSIPSGSIRLGLQPHAPTTVAPALYRGTVALARARGLPLSTHLAETPEEREFIGHARGPQRTLLERIGVWDDSIQDDLGRGLHPVEHLAPILEAAASQAGPGSPSPFLVAHVNDCDEKALETLARTGTRVAYCPRASGYFAAERHFGPHRYRDMLQAGITVALGTDSIVNLPPDAAGLSILDEMRFLHARDSTEPKTLLRMGTLNGARALGLPESAFRFSPGEGLAGLVAVRITERGQPVPSGFEVGGLGSALLGNAIAVPELLFAGNRCGLTETREL